MAARFCPSDIQDYITGLSPLYGSHCQNGKIYEENILANKVSLCDVNNKSESGADFVHRLDCYVTTG